MHRLPSVSVDYASVAVGYYVNHVQEICIADLGSQLNVMTMFSYKFIPVLLGGITSCATSDSAYSYTFLRSMVSLSSVVVHLLKLLE